MKSTFPGLPKEALAFFRDLKANNNRDWFDAHKDQYLAHVKQPVEALCAILSSELTRFAPAFATEPKKAVFRIYRDTRFSNDKTPYKDHAGALFWRNDLGKNSSAAFYVGITDTNIGIAGGIYGPDPELMRAVRSHLLEHHARFHKLATAKPLVAALGELQGDKLQRPPKGFLPETPGIEYIKMKAWFFYREIDPKVATTPQLVDEIISRFRKVAPVVEFLNEPLDAGKKRRPVFDLF
jgi:uncharacterized protein (TIGR02453 family)